MIKSDKVNYEEVQKIVADLKSSSNKELVAVMDFLGEDFEETKNMVIDLTIHLDNIENLYNTILKEHQQRNGQAPK
jgi:hypothetical protein